MVWSTEPGRLRHGWPRHPEGCVAASVLSLPLRRGASSSAVMTRARAAGSWEHRLAVDGERSRLDGVLLASSGTQFTGQL